MDQKHKSNLIITCLFTRRGHEDLDRGFIIQYLPERRLHDFCQRKERYAFPGTLELDSTNPSREDRKLLSYPPHFKYIVFI